MTDRSALHGTFRIERTYDAAPARVFAAFADAEAKAQWSACHDVKESAFDFRPGGREYTRMQSPGEPEFIVEARYHDIVAGERIVFSYDMRIDGTRVSVSLTTIEFAAAAGGTRLTFTEQAVSLDGHASLAEREEGTRIGLENLAAALERQLAQA